MWSKLLPQVLELLSVILIGPEFVRALLGKKRIAKAARAVRNAALTFAFLFQKPVLRTRFRLYARGGTIPRNAFYQGVAYAQKLEQLSRTPHGLTSEDIDQLWRELEATMRLSAESDREVRQLLQNPEYEETFKRIFGQSIPRNRNRPPTFDTSHPKDWLKTFLRLGGGLVWALVPLSCLWWLLLRDWNSTVPLFGCSAVALIAVGAVAWKSLFAAHLRSTIGLDPPSRVPDLVKVPLVGVQDTLYLHYRIRGVAHDAFIWIIRSVIAVLAAHSFGWISLPNMAITVGAGMLFGMVLITSTLTLVSLVSLPVWVVLAIAAWITVLGAWKKAARVTAAVGALLFIAAKLIAVFL